MTGLVAWNIALYSWTADTLVLDSAVRSVPQLAEFAVLRSFLISISVIRWMSQIGKAEVTITTSER